jgi:translation initiation factor IF-1
MRSSLNKLWEIMCMNSPKVGAHVKCKAYQRIWLKPSITFKVGQNFISSY